jgi:signal transduction histidine kinase
MSWPLREIMGRLLATASEDQVVEFLMEVRHHLGYDRARFWDVTWCPLDSRRFYVLRAWSSECTNAVRGTTIYDTPTTDEALQKGTPVWFTCADIAVRDRLEDFPWVQDFELCTRGWLEVPIQLDRDVLGVWTLDRARARTPSPSELDDIQMIASLAALRIRACRQSQIALCTAEIYANIDYIKPIEYCLASICTTMKVSCAAYFSIDPIRGVATKKAEVYYDGTVYKTVDSGEVDTTYRIGQYLTGTAIDNEQLRSIPDYRKLELRRPDLVYSDSSAFHSHLMSTPVRSVLFRKLDIRGSLRGLIRVVNRADCPDLRFTSVHNGILDRMHDPCAHIIALHAAAGRMTAIWDSFSAVLGALPKQEDSYRIIADALNENGFPIVVITVWVSDCRLRDCWSNNEGIGGALQQSTGELLFPDIRSVVEPESRDVDRLPSSLRTCLGIEHISCVYLVPTTEHVTEGAEPERVLVMIPLSVGADSEQTRPQGTAPSFWAERSNLLQLLNIFGRLAATVRSLDRNRRLLYLAEQAIGMIGHEIRSPASSLQSIAQLALYHATHALGDLHIGKAIAEKVAIVNAEARSMEKLITSPEELLAWLADQDKKVAYYAHFLDRVVADTLKWARMSGKIIEVHFEEIDLHAILRNVIEALDRDINEKYPLRVQVADAFRELGPVVADRVYIQTLFTNLLDNAVKYSWNRGAKHEYVVKVWANPQPRCVDMFVMNWGLGIEEADYDNIFAPFYRARIRDAKHTVRGVGLGLSVCKRIVRMHRGTISVRSKPTLDDKRRSERMEGYETTFGVRLPRDLPTGRIDLDAATLDK